MGKLRAVVIVALGAVIFATSSSGESLMVDFDRHHSSSGDPHMSTEFKMLGPAVRGAEGPVTASRSVSTASSSIVSDGSSAFVADADSGSVVRTNRAGAVTGRVPVAGASQLAINRRAGVIFATDRRNDRVAVINAKSMTLVASWKTPAEPYGIALSPDGRFALVTTVADHTLAAFDTSTGRVAWKVELLSEPRGVAVSPDGREATVTFLTRSAVGTIDLAAPKKTARYTAIGRPHTAATVRSVDSVPQAEGALGKSLPAQRRRKRAMPRHRRSRQGPVKTFARGAFATAYMKNAVAVVPYQRATPVQTMVGRRESRGTYGGGGISNPPIVHRIAFIGPRGKTSRAHVDVRVPRALAYDASKDVLYLAGKGDDKISVIAEASQPTAHFAGRLLLRNKKTRTSVLSSIRLSKRKSKRRPVAVNHFDLENRCGPTGLAIDAKGALLVHCGLSHRVQRIERDGMALKVVSTGPDLGRSRLSRTAREGREMFFRAADTRMSGLGAFACASCHPDGRADGLSWRIQGATLQTPLLVGRLAGSHPFKWDGQDATLQISLTQTVRRLGGTGIGSSDAGALRAFLTSLPKPRPATITDRRAVARGKKLFRSKVTGCASCHSGRLLTNGKSYDLAEDLKSVDTPSLVGLAHSAPYYHDGSAATLDAVLLENGSIHGMGRVSKLTGVQRSDLVAYLETL